MDSEKQSEGFEGVGSGRLGEPGGGYYGRHVFHGAQGVVHNNEFCYAEKKKVISDSKDHLSANH